MMVLPSSSVCPNPSSTDSLWGGLADSTRQLVRDTATLLLLLITVLALASGSALRGNSWRWDCLFT